MYAPPRAMALVEAGSSRTLTQLDQLQGDLLSCLYVYREADTFNGNSAAAPQDHRIDTHQVTAEVDQRATAVAGVDRSIGLDQVIQCDSRRGFDGPSQGCYDYDRDCGPTR